MQCRKSLCPLLLLVACQGVTGWLVMSRDSFRPCPTSLFTALCCLVFALSLYLLLVVLDQGFRSEEGIKKRILISLFQGKLVLAQVCFLAWSDVCLLIIMLRSEAHCAEGNLIKKLAVLLTVPSLLLFISAFRILSYYFKYKPFFIRREFHVRQVMVMQQRGRRASHRTARAKRPLLQQRPEPATRARW